MIKTTIKWLGRLFLLLFLSSVLFMAHEWFADKPLRFKSLLDRIVVQLAFKSPETLTSLGFLESVGITAHNAKLDEASLAQENEFYDLLPKIRQDIVQYSQKELSPSDQLSQEIALYLLDNAIESSPFRYHNYPVNQLFGVQSSFPSFMDAQHQVNNVEDAEHYISRLAAIERKFIQLIEGLKYRENNGIIPPRFVIERVLEEMENFIEQPIEKNILYVSLKNKMEQTEQAAANSNSSIFSTQQQHQLLAQAKAQIITSVHPAYQLFIHYFTLLKYKSTDDDGWWKLPDGEAAYASALKFYTTTNYSADFIHQTGLAEVSRIQQEIMTILANEKYDTSHGFTHSINKLKSNPKFYYPDSEAGRQQILQDYQQILDDISAGLNGAFNTRPQATMQVRRIPQFKEKTAPGAYYQQPAIDGSRPGMFFANLYDIKATPKYSMRTLAYHEGIPGHHFQIAIGMEARNLPLFRKASLFTAYTEGWALYAEQVAWELGFQNDPFDNIGRLQAELFRAVRLVVDTGIHHKRWDRQEAIEYMLTNTGMANSDVIAEIERYIVMPGQATAYKVGMMKILDIRKNAKNRLGDKFNLAEFHDVILKNGAMPLDILAKNIDNYINDKLNSSLKLRP